MYRHASNFLNLTANFQPFRSPRLTARRFTRRLLPEGALQQ
jgi:hypothetical protein